MKTAHLKEEMNKLELDIYLKRMSNKTKDKMEIERLKKEYDKLKKEYEKR